jgi:hypothetical protein
MKSQQAHSHGNTIPLCREPTRNGFRQLKQELYLMATIPASVRESLPNMELKPLFHFSRMNLNEKLITVGDRAISVTMWKPPKKTEAFETCEPLK